MQKHVITLCLSFLLIAGIAGTICAHPVDADFVFDGLNLDLGAGEYDRTVLVILMGATIEEILKPDIMPLADFGSEVDVSFEFDPGAPEIFELILQDDVQIAVLTEPFPDSVTTEMLQGLGFTGEPYSISISSDDLVVVLTAEERYFLLSGFQRSDWTLHLDVEEISPIIPEPSTLLLVGLGLLGLLGLMRRKKGILLTLFALAGLASLMYAGNIEAQTESLVTIVKEGPGNGIVRVGEDVCDLTCEEMSVPYVDKRAVVLKVEPAEDSYFVRWKKTDGSSSEGALHIQPGDTVIAVFGKKWVPFDSAAPAGPQTPPEIQVPASTMQEVIVDLHIPGMNVALREAEGQAYQQLTISGGGHATDVGKPQIPMMGRFIALPAGADVNVEVLGASFTELPEFTVFPAQEPLPEVEGAPIPPFTVDSDLYRQDAWYPSEVAELEGPVMIRGASVVILRVFPVQFNPAKRSVRVYSNLRVKLAFEGGEDFFIADRLQSPSFRQLFGGLLLNAGIVVPPGAFLLRGGDLLIITHPDFLDAANTLAAWKIQKGIPTVVRTTTQTGSTAAEIQQYIQNAYDHWIQPPAYVIFIGDAEFIPCHYVTTHPYTDIPQGVVGTDLYYATVDGSDYFPDISTGRLVVDTLAQANKRVNDIIAYEKNPPADVDFYTHAAIAAYFQDNDNPNTPNVNERDGYADRRFAHTSENVRDYLVASGYTADRIYATPSAVTPTNWSTSYWPGTGAAIPTELLKPTFPWDGDSTDITNAINDGRFLVTHRDHGATWGWGDPQYTTANVQALTNGAELPVVWSINCQTGWFDNETDAASTNTAATTIHFSEAWERNVNGGAIGVIAATRVSYSGHNDRLIWGWMDAIWPNFESSYSPSGTPFDSPVWEMGPVLNYGKYYYANHYGDSTTRRIEFEMFHWFGDPTMQIWTGAPQTLSVSHPPKLPQGSTSINVTVNQADALISISKSGVLLGKALSTVGANTVAWASALSAGDEITITVTKHNFRPYEGAATVVSCYPTLPDPQLVFTGMEDYTANSQEWTRFLLSVTNRSAFPDALFEPAPHLPPCGLNTNSSRTWVNIYDDQDHYLYGFCALSQADDLDDISFAIPRGSTPPNAVYIELLDRECDITYTSNAVLIDSGALQEDCISFNPGAIAVVNIGGSWKIVEGSMWMLDFADNEDEARKSFDILQHYQMNDQCFVGRPDASLEYYLVNGSAPVGPFPDEDCVDFNPATIEVANIGGRWKIVDGSHLMLDFEDNEDEAWASYNIIQKYGFTQMCFVGRPDASLMYFRQ